MLPYIDASGTACSSSSSQQSAVDAKHQRVRTSVVVVRLFYYTHCDREYKDLFIINMNNITVLIFSYIMLCTRRTNRDLTKLYHDVKRGLTQLAPNRTNSASAVSWTPSMGHSCDRSWVGEGNQNPYNVLGCDGALLPAFACGAIARKVKNERPRVSIKMDLFASSLHFYFYHSALSSKIGRSERSHTAPFRRQAHRQATPPHLFTLQ